jgi:excisionase family DNA binding protein
MDMAISKGRLSVTAAAKVIGVTTGRVRQMIRSGELKAVKVETHLVGSGYYYEVPLAEAKRAAAVPQSGGRPRVSSTG